MNYMTLKNLHCGHIRNKKKHNPIMKKLTVESHIFSLMGCKLRDRTTTGSNTVTF